jgi:DNA-binding GntR family transcriptional regulator
MTDETDAGLLGDAVYARLVDWIFTGELAPDAPLSVPALASRLEVSRSPVRDSVQRLIAEGMAVHTPRAGARVARLSAREIDDVMKVRELLDGYAALHATERATPADVEQLHELLARQESLLDRPADPVLDARLDLEFHTRVRDLADNAALSDALHRLDTRAHLHHSGLWSEQSNRDYAVREHRRIVEAIEVGDALAAQGAASSHVAALIVRMRRHRES